MEDGPTQKSIREAREKELLQEGVALYNAEKDPNKQIEKTHPKVGPPENHFPCVKIFVAFSQHVL